MRRADNTRLPHDRPLVLVSNHANYMEAMILGDDNSWVGLVALRDRARAEILAHCGEPDLADQVTIALPEWVRP